VRSRDHLQMLSQTSRVRRTTKKASHVPSGFAHAFHSFLEGVVGLLRCVEIVNSAMIATIYSRIRTPVASISHRNRQLTAGSPGRSQPLVSR
jgi:hypothetical protein